MHISLDSALGRQRRLNSVGESVLQIAPNAAAAYSLRSLTGGDPKVVRVRRASENSERDFTSTEITSGALLAFVNESVTASYNAEDGSLSGLSRIDFDGSSTTLSNVSSGALGGTRSFKVDITSGTSTNTGYPRVRRSTGGDLALFAGLQYRLKCKIKLTSGAARVKARLGTSGSNNAFNFQTLQVGQLVEINETFTPTATINSNNIEFVFDGTFGEGTILLDDIELTALTSNGFVETWYDQSGNVPARDAVQPTASKQPKIVNAGSYLSELNFDGANYSLNSINLISSLNSASAFIVAKTADDTLSGKTPVALSGGSDRFYIPVISSGSYYFGYDASSTAIEIGDADTDYHLFTGIAGSSNAEGFMDGQSGGTLTSVSDYTALIAGGIGAINNTQSWNGGIREVVVYNSDQSANRTALETNIAAANGVTLS